MQHRNFLGLALVLFSLRAPAQVMELREKYQTSFVSINLEQTEIQFADGSVGTQGLSVDYSYQLRPRLFAEVGLNTGFSGEINSLDAAFLGVNAYAMFAPFGSCCSGEKSILIESKTTYVEKRERQNLWLIGAGIEQLLLNGSEQVYSSSGWGVQGAAFLNLWQQNIRFNLKAAHLTSAGNPVTVYFGSVGIFFSF